MWLSATIIPYVPLLRRFARALLGTQAAGDACVAATLRAILANPSDFEPRAEPKVALYRLFLHIVRGDSQTGATAREIAEDHLSLFKKVSAISAMAERPRVAFLLSAMEDFTLAEIAQTLDCLQEQARAMIVEAEREISAQTGASVLIIEDESIVALDLQDLLQHLGHKVVAIATTRGEAVRAALEFHPRLILSDVKLADDTSGLDAVNDILHDFETPVIFITGLPEQLLTGQMPEPAFLIGKPFTAESVIAAVAQALFFDRKCFAPGPEQSAPVGAMLTSP